MVSSIQNLIRSGDVFAAVEQIQCGGTPAETAGRYTSLLRDLYWKAHDLPAVVAVGRAGILYCLTQSRVEGAAADLSEQLRSTAKGLAYDVGSFTWPGWEEPGIDPAPADLAAGMECARLNLQLAIELNKPSDRVSMAHWLVGAHALVVPNADLAERNFQQAVDILPDLESGPSALKLYSMGCVAVARLCRKSNDDAAIADFESIASRLMQLASEDAAVYLPQLHTARRLFASAR